MYLKSLTLKGFKSFADRTVMKFEPGVAAIVGPNGSGKSNISDAVLWVLGERNAKNLRGQSMEDVIFAGSSARKPVSVAEVELCLDNTDGTLPVDFAEVSIGRRMYRSGESEYLINGNVVRRMDVLDILHDSGLGTGTNSIISQGNLDSVLSSKPEDRRALIEEAAGILKHKERKAKSERKLAQMDAHLDRVHDITAEVERQLKPLERKARKARTYQTLSSELSELQLALAVDFLRGLQKRWDSILEQEQDLNKRQALTKERLDKSEADLDELQQRLQSRGSKESSLNDNYRRAQTSFERLHSTALVVREKRANFLSEAERLTRSEEESKVRRQAAERELALAHEAVEKARDEFNNAQFALTKLEEDHKKQTGERNALRKRVDTLMHEQRALVHRQETIQATQEALKENLSEKRARAQVIDAHVEDAQKRLATAKEQADTLAKASDELAAQLEQAQVADRSARERLNALVVKRDQARKALDAAREELTHATAERTALEEVVRASEAANPLMAEILSCQEEVAPTSRQLTHVLKTPSNLDGVVEALLGDALSGLLTQDAADAQALARHALQSPAFGKALMLAGPAGGATGADAAHADRDSTDAEAVMGTTQAASAGEIPCAIPGARRLVEEVEVDPAYASQINALLGDAFVVDTFDSALELHQRHPSLRFASLDGCVVDATGAITVFRPSEEQAHNSALARQRALKQAQQREGKAQQAYDLKQEEDQRVEADLRGAQTESLTCSETLANVKGASESARRDAQQSAQSASALEQELSRLLKEQAENASFLEKAQPDSDQLEQDLAKVMADLELNKEQVSKLEETLSPLRRTIVTLSEKLSDARLESARLSERFAYAQRMEQTRKQEISSSEREDEASDKRRVVAQVAARRADELLSVLMSLSDAASLISLKLEQESRTEQERSRTLHDQIAQATHASREIRQEFEAQNTQLAEVRIEKGKLEIQVESGIKTIVEDCNTSLETAMELEELQDRAATEEQAASLTRRIKNMGTINPDAAEEFEQVQKRYEYLSSQLEDMRLARRSLSRIVSVIDERMKNDFVATFEQVNANFSEIFSTLFPGGHAHLSLTDPDDLEHTGVDVNAQPQGKRVKKMSLLSGGEKSMTAMALLFAVYRIRQTPFYILDEVEAALDDTNLRRLIAYLNVIRHQTQFIMITHQRRTMESADILYGVSMQADGITKVISQKLEKAQHKED